MCGKVGHTTGACDFSGKKRILVLMTLEDLEFTDYFLNKFVGTTYSQETMLVTLSIAFWKGLGDVFYLLSHILN